MFQFGKQKTNQVEPEEVQLDSNQAMLRASLNLDYATELAGRTKNVQGLLAVATVWMELADRLSGTPTKKLPVGFSQEGIDDGEFSNQSESRSEFHKKFR